MLALLWLLLPASAAVILRIDITDPAQITFTATGANSENDDDQSFLSEGITLLDFFSVSVEDPNVAFFESPSNLWSPGGNFAYTTLSSSAFTNAAPFVYDDLAIFGSGFSTQDFSTNAPALTGSAVADLTAWAAWIPAAGTVGNIRSGDGISFSGPQIGQYTVVPEPSTAALAAAGLLLAARFIRRR